MVSSRHGVPETGHLTRIARSAVAFAYYVAGASVTEGLLFLPTCLLLFIPAWLLSLVGALAEKLLALVFGEYTSKDGTHPVSLLGYVDNFDFKDPPHLGRALPKFPTREVLSYDNVQIFQSIVNLSYEDWAVVSDVLQGWKVSGLEHAAGYCVQKLTWRSDDGKLKEVMLDVNAYLIPVNDAVVVAFRGTDPFELQDWMTDWNVYGSEVVGCHGRVHPGFRTALGLDRDLQALQHAKTTVTISALNEGRPTKSVVNNTLTHLLQGKLLQILNVTSAKRIFVVGHSLGGALGAVFAAALNVSSPSEDDTGACANKPLVEGLYTIGQPRMGDASFGQNLESWLKHSAEHPTYLRLVNANDIVPQMPPAGPQDLGPTAYQHCGQLIFITAFGNIYRQFEQSNITFLLAVFVSISSALNVTTLYLYSWWLYLQSPETLKTAEFPGLLLALAKWAALGFFPHGIVQHAPANYSMAVMNAKPAVWRLEKQPGLLDELRADISRLRSVKMAKRRLKAVSSRLTSWAQNLQQKA